MKNSSRVRRVFAAGGVAAMLATGAAVAATPANAAQVGCATGLIVNAVGQSKPYITCASIPGYEQRGRADCTAAPDTYTKWVKSWGTSEGGYCLFGARGAILERRPA